MRYHKECKAPCEPDTEGQAAVVMQSRVAAARQAHAEALLQRLAPLLLLESDSRLPNALRWVKDLHPKNFTRFRRALPLEVERATRSGDFDAFEDWLSDWQIAAEIAADPALQRRLRVRA